MSLDSDRENRVPNKYWKSDVDRAIQYMKWFLGILGIWPMIKKNAKISERWISKILIILGYSLITFVIIPTVSHLILREKVSTKRIKLLGPIGMRLTNIIKYTTIILHRQNLRMCIEQVKNDWMQVDNSIDREIMVKYAKLGRSISFLCGLFMFSAGLTYHTILPWWRSRRINSLNQTMRPLVYPGFDLFVDSQSSPTYEIILYTTFISALVSCTITTAACSLGAMFVTHVCGQIQLLMARLDHLLDPVKDGSNVLHDRVAFIVRCHVRVFRFTETIERALREIYLVEFISSTLLICYLEYFCMMEWDNSDTVAIITYFMLLVSVTINVFIFCHIGQLLKDQCLEIGKAAYMIDWYRLPNKVGRTLVLIIAMAYYPRKLTAGGMVEVSIITFGTIIKTSLTYLSMLRAMTS